MLADVDIGRPNAATSSALKEQLRGALVVFEVRHRLLGGRQIGSMLETGPPRALFTLPTTATAAARSGYEPSPDGQRFLVTAVVSQASPITVIMNWKPPVR